MANAKLAVINGQADMPFLQIVSQFPCKCSSGLGGHLILVPVPHSQPLALGFQIPEDTFKRFSMYTQDLPSVVLDLDNTFVMAEPFPGISVRSILEIGAALCLHDAQFEGAFLSHSSVEEM